MTIQDFRKQGFKIYVTHRRRYYSNGPQKGKRILPFALSKNEALLEGLSSDNLVATGGYIQLELANQAGNTLEIVEVHCSNGDAYNKKVGIHLATQELLVRLARKTLKKLL